MRRVFVLIGFTLFVLFTIAACSPTFPLINPNPPTPWIIGPVLTPGPITTTATVTDGVVLTTTVVPTDTPSPTTEALTTTVEATPECLIKGNINSNGERIYYTKDSINYTNTKITLPGERYFCTEAEAEAAGWRKALR